jgi:hypothetical protein
LPAEPVLHFVYNVDGTPAALLLDFVHRLREPETYPCRLCDVTYGRLLKKGEWRRFVDALPVRSRFHLRAGFQRRFPAQSNEPLPAIFVERPGAGLATLVPAEDLNAVADLAALQELVSKKVASLDRR